MTGDKGYKWNQKSNFVTVPSHLCPNITPLLTRFCLHTKFPIRSSIIYILWEVLMKLKKKQNKRKCSNLLYEAIDFVFFFKSLFIFIGKTDLRVAPDTEVSRVLLLREGRKGWGWGRVTDRAGVAGCSVWRTGWLHWSLLWISFPYFSKCYMFPPALSFKLFNLSTSSWIVGSSLTLYC